MIVVAVVASGGGGSSSPSGTPANASSGDYVGKGQNIQRIAFTLRGSGRTVSGLHGTFAVSCASSGGSSYQMQTFTDPDAIAMGADGTFADHYEINAPGGIRATLTVDGSVTGRTATGHLQFAEPYCGTPLDGWSAAASGQALPPVPGYTPPNASACTPQPCSVLGGVKLAVEAVRIVTEAGDPNTRGIDIVFTADNGSSAPASVSDGNFALTPQGGTALRSSYAGFVDSSGQQVGCLRGNVPLLAPGQSEAHQHACFLPPADLAGQPLTLYWQVTGRGSATLPIGPAR